MTTPKNSQLQQQQHDVENCLLPSTMQEDQQPQSNATASSTITTTSTTTKRKPMEVEFVYDNPEHKWKNANGQDEFMDCQVEDALWELARQEFGGTRYNDVDWNHKDIKRSINWTERQVYYCPFSKHGCKFRICRVKAHETPTVNEFYIPTIKGTSDGNRGGIRVQHDCHPTLQEFDMDLFKLTAIQTYQHLHQRPKVLFLKVGKQGMPISNKHRNKVKRSLQHLRRKIRTKYSFHQDGNKENNSTIGRPQSPRKVKQTTVSKPTLPPSLKEHKNDNNVNNDNLLRLCMACLGPRNTPEKLPQQQGGMETEFTLQRITSSSTTTTEQAREHSNPSATLINALDTTSEESAWV